MIKAHVNILIAPIKTPFTEIIAVHKEGKVDENNLPRRP
jgi:hypothetical protein